MPHPTYHPVPAYAYRSPAFVALVADSYRHLGRPADPRRFAARIEAGDPQLLTSLRTVAQAERRHPDTRRERELATHLHALLKRRLPVFTLDRGFEFAYAAERGERQCLLQSVTLAALLQQAGIPAGAAMVWRSERGETSNLGHVVTLMHLADGRDLEVDASDRAPFARHDGLFLPVGGREHFVQVRFAPGSPEIAGYVPEGGAPVGVSAAGPLSLAYLRSQFDYYRGERVPGGLLGRPPQPEALRRAAALLERSVRTCPQNPLSLYQLGNVRTRLKDPRAEATLRQARALYAREGRVPESATSLHALKPARSAAVTR